MPAVPVVTIPTEMRGDTLDYALTVSGVDLTQSGTKMWFTGALVKGSPDAAAVWQKTIGNGITVTGATTATATLQPADTAGLLDGAVVYYDVQVKTPAGRVQTAFEGTIVFEIDVTQGTT